ncbi:MAG: phenylalanine--tRNA ligase subunit alpha [Candidatus Handelsmanbacteria bacterium RIFCSPLOWO2_12_FULL_64_10]|uniref:Phenylalanine--tRNA ligase alpha subunit n=1 Tax=Handelsmanbacteria sp. (strain RIFCSPLOWO2_12_FULL_64_10) TaxID=1817868 RepID=A0A1F6CAQ0_HANXR|nr:MAG: phenylalanine--tRNA ligase subunit alpha [Candidatus Handelsmanbacteria bacterium RIFCSPLOWO2_12_FULL_64_10]
MLDRIEEIRKAAEQEIWACADLRALDLLRAKYLGRGDGMLTEVLRGIGTLNAALRPKVGEAAGRAKNEISALLEEVKSRLDSRLETAQAGFDVTLPGRRPALGRRHLLTQITDELVGIFERIGFSLADGPEVETEYHNFDALNTPADHPARDLHDTFYLEGGGLLLRSHTSTVQVRTMERTPPPVRIISTGRCYRRDALDATHHFAFHQIEGLWVDRGVTFGDLKGVIIYLAHQFLGKEVSVRFRPSFFPFTEPSAEYDFSCIFCEGQGCRVCKRTGWIEIAGAGMVDPAVFEAVGYDPEAVTGFAFGMGVERVGMLKYGVDDIRVFLESDLRFIEQF